MRHRATLGLLALLLATACRRSEPPVPDRWSTPAPPRMYPLGEACDTPRTPTAHVGDAAVPVGPEERCGRAGRVAVLVFSPGAPRALRPPLPASAVTRRVPVGKVRAVVEGSRVLLDVDCEICRTDGDRLWVGDLDLMTEAQITELQRLAGLPEKPLLGDAAAWRRALGG